MPANAAQHSNLIHPQRPKNLPRSKGTIVAQKSSPHCPRLRNPLRFRPGLTFSQSNAHCTIKFPPARRSSFAGALKNSYADAPARDSLSYRHGPSETFSRISYRRRSFAHARIALAGGFTPPLSEGNLERRKRCGICKLRRLCCVRALVVQKVGIVWGRLEFFFPVKLN